MAWATKYRFRWNSVHGVEFNIYIQKDGYEGDVIQRPLGRAPLLRKKKNGPICGTSLEIYAECQVDGEFSELYTSNPKEFLVLLTRGNDTIWSGFVSTELYSEPSVAPPYDVQIVATDGLGELKLNEYVAMGEVSLATMFRRLLSYTGKGRDIYFAWQIAEDGEGCVDLLDDTLLNFDYRAGDKVYDVLTTLLNSFNATLTLHDNIWLVTRETDIPNGSVPYAYRVPASSSGGSASLESIPEVTTTVGKMGVANMWPVGNYSSVIEPARKSVSLAAPWHFEQILANPQLQQLLGGWNQYGGVSWRSGQIPQASYQYCKVWLGGGSTPLTAGGLIFQTFQIEGLLSAIELSINIIPLIAGAKYSLYVSYHETQSGNWYYGTEEGWFTGAGPSEGKDIAEQQTVSIVVPNPQNNNAGQMGIYIQGQGISVDHPSAKLIKGYKGYRDTLYIDNDARGEADEVEIIHGRVTAEEFTLPGEISGVLMKEVNGEKEYIYNFEDALHSNADFLALQALSYAHSVALPRLRQEGTLNVPATLITIPMLMSFGNVAYIVETFDWDLVNEEAKVSVLSLPASSLVVEGENVQWLESSYSGSSSSSGGSGGGGVTPMPSGVTLRDVWRSLTNTPSLTDYGDATLIAAAHLASLFTVETRTSGANTYYYLKLNTTYEGLVSAGYITAGAAASASDARLKDKIRTIQPEKALEFLALLRGCEWVWNGKHPSLEGQRGSGLIAQEVQKVMPWAVLDFDGELSLNYNSFWGIAIPVMQAQQRQIEKLERRVARLEKAIDSILSKEDVE